MECSWVLYTGSIPYTLPGGDSVIASTVYSRDIVKSYISFDIQRAIGVKGAKVEGDQICSFHFYC